LSLESGLIHVAHVGDSRCYRYREGEFEQLTRDHSLVNDALEMKPDLTEEELARLPKNIITRALGMREAVAVDIRTEKLLAGDTFLICSDGLSSMLSDRQISTLIEDGEDPRGICKELVARANEAGGVDNVSALIIRVIEKSETVPVPVTQSIMPGPLPSGHAEGLLDMAMALNRQAFTDEQTLTSTPSDIRIAKCEKCHAELTIGTLFCVDCGAPI
jgi:serine/threonine protein phosphatase PrpC